MNKHPLVEQFIDAVQWVVNDCVPAVPSRPLLVATDLSQKIVDADAFEDASDPVCALMDALDEVEWGFWPPDEFGSNTAYVAIDTISTLAEALVAYRKAIANQEAAP